MRSYQIKLAGRKNNEELISLIKSNPIVMEASYIIDRYPDFFKLHDYFTGSKVLIATDKNSKLLLSCLSLFKYKGRVGDSVIPFHYITDLNRRNSPRGVRSPIDLVNNAFLQYWDSRFLCCLINKANTRANRITQSKLLVYSLLHLGTFDYFEVVPLKKHKIPAKYQFSSPDDDNDLQSGLDYINDFYKNYMLFAPLTKKEINRMIDELPGFSMKNIILMKEGEELKGAMIYYDPTELFSITIAGLDPKSRFFTGILSAIHKLTGLFLSLPKCGDKIKSLQLRYFAYNKEEDIYLFKYLNNIAYRKKFHTISFLIDEKKHFNYSNRMVFKYKSFLYGVSKKGLVAGAEYFKKSPLFFDITLG
jgi:hypothetical protein